MTTSSSIVGYQSMNDGAYKREYKGEGQPLNISMDTTIQSLAAEIKDKAYDYRLELMISEREYSDFFKMNGENQIGRLAKPTSWLTRQIGIKTDNDRCRGFRLLFSVLAKGQTRSEAIELLDYLKPRHQDKIKRIYGERLFLSSQILKARFRTEEGREQINGFSTESTLTGINLGEIVYLADFIP